MAPFVSKNQETSITAVRSLESALVCRRLLSKRFSLSFCDPNSSAAIEAIQLILSVAGAHGGSDIAIVQARLMTMYTFHDPKLRSQAPVQHTKDMTNIP